MDKLLTLYWGVPSFIPNSPCLSDVLLNMTLAVGGLILNSQTLLIIFANSLDPVQACWAYSWNIFECPFWKKISKGTFKITQHARVKRVNKKLRRKIVSIFLPISFNICFGCSKNHLIEMVLLSTHNICFGWEIRKLNFRYTLITKVLKECMIIKYKKNLMHYWARLGITIFENYQICLNCYSLNNINI